MMSPQDALVKYLKDNGFHVIRGILASKDILGNPLEPISYLKYKTILYVAVRTTDLELFNVDNEPNALPYALQNILFSDPDLFRLIDQRKSLADKSIGN